MLVGVVLLGKIGFFAVVPIARSIDCHNRLLSFVRRMEVARLGVSPVARATHDVV